MGILGLLGGFLAAILLGQQCEKTKQAEREAEYHREVAERKVETNEEAYAQVEYQTEQEGRIDQARDTYEQDRSNEDNRQRYMDSVRDRYRGQ